MMRNAAKLHGARWGTGLAVTLLVVMVLQQSFASLNRRTQSERCQTAVASLASSQGQAVAGAITELRQFPDDLVVNELEDRLSVAAAGESFALQCALAKFGRADIEALVSHVPTVPSDSADNLVTALRHAAPEEVLNALQVAWSNADEDDYRLKSRFAVIALHLGDSTFASELCQPRPDLIQRTVFIDLVSAWHGDHVRLADRAQTVRDPELQSALCLAVGSTTTESVGESEHAAWQPLLSDWYLHVDKCGVHSASEWALRQWKLPIPEIPQSTETRPEREWSHNSVGMTMVRIPAGSFQNWHNVFGQQMPSPQTITLTQPYLMSSCEVSVEQYRLALDDPECPDAERPCRSARFDPSGQPNNTDCYWIGQDTEISPTGKHPIQNVCWIEAVMYCNWLSRREGLQPCYERTGKIWNIPTGYFDEWKLVPDRDGYRLPTNAEWEHACRASTSTGFSFGSQDRYADQYVVLGTTTQPCGSRLPNRWGLFDMHGNISELVQDWASGYRFDKSEEIIDPFGPEREDRLNKVICGGAFPEGRLFAIQSHFLASAVNVVWYAHVGFRVARTPTR